MPVIPKNISISKDPSNAKNRYLRDLIDSSLSITSKYLEKRKREDSRKTANKMPNKVCRFKKTFNLLSSP